MPYYVFECVYIYIGVDTRWNPVTRVCLNIFTRIVSQWGSSYFDEWRDPIIITTSFLIFFDVFHLATSILELHFVCLRCDLPSFVTSTRLCWGNTPFIRYAKSRCKIDQWVKRQSASASCGGRGLTFSTLRLNISMELHWSVLMFIHFKAL